MPTIIINDLARYVFERAFIFRPLFFGVTASYFECVLLCCCLVSVHCCEQGFALDKLMVFREFPHLQRSVWCKSKSVLSSYYGLLRGI